MDMQPATLEHSTGRAVPGFADRDAFDAGVMYVEVQFDVTSRPTFLHRSKVIGFDSLASHFTVVERAHENCAGCERAAESARVTARATGSVGATAIDDGRALREPYYHSARVERKPVTVVIPDVEGAYLEPHEYDSFPKPVPFWIVRCNHPSHGPIALNSGHHYRAEAKHHAELLVIRHNVDEHA